MNKTTKMLVNCLAAFFALCVFVALFDDDEKSNNQGEKEQITKSEFIETKSEKAEEKKGNSIVGTYEITDRVGCTIHLTLNKDETATISGVRGEGVTYYCSWHNAEWQGAEIRIDFSDKKPYLVYEGGADDNMLEDLYIKEGWIYSGLSNVKSKNPNWRLKLKKIK